MKHLSKIFFLISIMFGVYFSDANNLAETFDCLMGKYDCKNDLYNECVENRSKAAWFPETARAYQFARTQFERYSIENEKQKLKNTSIIPKIIHHIWLGGGVPEKYSAWISSWDQYNPGWTHIIWTDEDIKYLKLCNIKLFKQARILAEKADILRLELINLFGGLYVDTDYECLKSFDQFHYCNSFYTSALDIGILQDFL